MKTISSLFVLGYYINNDGMIVCYRFNYLFTCLFIYLSIYNTLYLFLFY